MLRDPSNTQITPIIQVAIAPVVLLAGVGAFLDVCASRRARIGSEQRF